MEILSITNFLVIKKAVFQVSKVNIIIGPQANGKSILVKLLYLFRAIMNESFLMSIKNNESKQEFIKNIEDLFEKYFPKYAWKDKEFNIHYKLDDIEFVISKTSSQRNIKIEVNDIVSKMHRDLKSKYKKELKQKPDENRFIDAFWEFKFNYIFKEKPVSKYFNDPLFIPASRSFFANLQKNIFSFLSKNIDIDPFMSEFGSKYEFAKKIHSDSRFAKTRFENDPIYEKIQKIVESILNGSYRYKDDQDWIETKNGDTINLSNASSGQQESLPMLLILSIFPFMNSEERENIYFIEEPEAHLFPTSQKHIISLIGLLYNKNRQSVITTHSPYILTALNNLLLANDIKSKYGSESLNGIIDEEFCINFDDVKAYTITQGKLVSIMDNEERLIGMNIIDSVSDEFNNTFDKLLSLQV
jgi:predicted ATPase